MREVVFHDRVLHLVNDFVASHPPERGGILIGPIGLPVVSEFLPDPDAIATGATFTPSDQVDAKVQLSTGGVIEVKGVLHSHPYGMDHPSGGDEHSFARWLTRMPWMSGLIAPIVTERRRLGRLAEHKVELANGEMSVFVAERRGDGTVKVMPAAVRVLEIDDAAAILADRFGLVAGPVEPAYVPVGGHLMASGTLVSGEGHVWTLMVPYTYPLHPPMILRPVSRGDGSGLEVLGLHWDLNVPDEARFASALARVELAEEASPSVEPAVDTTAETFAASPSDVVRVGLRARLDGSISTSVQNRSVLVVGLGSGGSQTVEAMTRSSVERFVLVDPDVVEPPNLSRSTYLADDLGLAKTQAMARQVLAINPAATVAAYRNHLNDLSPDELGQMVDDVDLVVAATDDPDAQYRLNRVAWERGCPAVFAGIYEGGAAGEIVFTIPGVTACFRCATGGVRGGRRQTAALNYGTGQLVAEPALGPDITHVVSASVKVGLGLLELSDPAAAGNSAASLVVEAAAKGWTFLQMAMVANYDFFPRVFGDTLGQHAYQSVWLETRSDPSCNVCGTAPTADVVAVPVDRSALVPVEEGSRTETAAQIVADGEQPSPFEGAGVGPEQDGDGDSDSDSDSDSPVPVDIEPIVDQGGCETDDDLTPETTADPHPGAPSVVEVDAAHDARWSSW